jgi:hypothetical protein
MGLFKHGSCMPWVMLFLHATILKKCSFVGTGKLWKLFCLMPQDLNLSQCLISHRTKSCGLSDPRCIRTCRTESCGVSVPLRKIAELCTFSSRHLFCGVWYPTEQSPAGPDTPSNKVLCGIRHLARYQTPGNNFWTQISPRIWNRIQKCFRVWIRCPIRSIDEKNQR